ncbi:MAG: hypothetical protein H6R26_3067 [Proteobacteria bacterium]|nr:hypothetical protein [Pseudomonadota bacterium]
MSQDQTFLEGEGDAWFARNSASLAPASSDEPVPSVLADVAIAPSEIVMDTGSVSE